MSAKKITPPAMDIYEHASASRLDLLATCPGSMTLSWDRSVSGAARRGTELHRFLEAVFLRGRDSALEDAPAARREECELLKLKSLGRQLGLALPDSGPILPPGAQLVVEAAHRWHVINRKAEHLGDRIGRDYPRASGWIPGTLDLALVWPAERRGLLVDYKSGFAELDPPDELRQLHHGALCLADRFGLDEVRVAVADISIPARPQVASAVMDRFALDLAADGLSAMFVRGAAAARAPERVDGAAPHFVTGSHCATCPAFERCPAQVTMAVTLATVGRELAPGRREVLALRETLGDCLTPAQVRDVLPLLEAGEAFLARVRGAVERYGAAGAVDLGNGMWLAEVATGRRQVDIARAQEALAEALADTDTPNHVLGVAIPQVAVCTGDSINEAARILAEQEDTTIKEQEARLWGILTRSGAAAKSPSRKVKVVRADQVEPGTPRRELGEPPTPVPPPPVKPSADVAKMTAQAKAKPPAPLPAGSKAFTAALAKIAKAKDPAAVIAAIPDAGEVEPDEFTHLSFMARARQAELKAAAS